MRIDGSVGTASQNHHPTGWTITAVTTNIINDPIGNDTSPQLKPAIII